jgi:hypothetical protein
MVAEPGKMEAAVELRDGTTCLNMWLLVSKNKSESTGAKASDTAE